MKVLFICEGNMMRSQMAEFFYNEATNSKDSMSAGVKATLLNYASKRGEIVMSEIGKTLDGHFSKQVTEEMAKQADRVILFSVDHVPEFLVDNPKVENWEILDSGHFMDGETLDVDRQVRDEIKLRVEKLIQGQ